MKADKRFDKSEKVTSDEVKSITGCSLMVCSMTAPCTWPDIVAPGQSLSDEVTDMQAPKVYAA